MATVTLSERGQTVIPSEIRKGLHLKEGVKLEVFRFGEAIVFVPIPRDVVKSLSKLGKKKAKISSVDEIRQMRLESERY